MRRNGFDSDVVLRSQISRNPSPCRDGYRQAWKDFCHICRPLIFWLLALSWASLLTFILIHIAILSSGSGYDYFGSLAACLPDGSFSVRPEEFHYLSMSGFFQITLRFGDYDFTQVKTIDIAWDILVGRGGQALLALISWRVFAKYVTKSMEVSPVTFKTYQSIFLKNESLLIAIPRMIRDFATRHGLQSKIAMVFMISSMAFILAFPSLASAMTGYDSKVSAYVNTTDSNYVPFEYFEFAVYVIHDGERIALTNESIVSVMHGRGEQPVLLTSRIGQSYDVFCSEKDILISNDDALEQCYMMGNVSNYVDQHGLFGSKNENSTFRDHALAPPVLNISAFYPSGADRYSLEGNPHVTWFYDNNLYDLETITKEGKCQTVLDSYQWGFSVMQLLLMNILLIAWSIGTYVMWRRSSTRNGVAGEYKAVLELADAIRANLPEDVQGHDITTSTETNLRRRIKNDLRGGSISYETPWSCETSLS